MHNIILMFACTHSYDASLVNHQNIVSKNQSSLSTAVGKKKGMQR